MFSHFIMYITFVRFINWSYDMKSITLWWWILVLFVLKSVKILGSRLCWCLHTRNHSLPYIWESMVYPLEVGILEVDAEFTTRGHFDYRTYVQITEVTRIFVGNVGYEWHYFTFKRILYRLQIFMSTPCQTHI